MSDSPEPTGKEPELPRRGFMAKAGAVTAAVAATPFLTRLTLAQVQVPQQKMPGAPGQPVAPGQPQPVLKLAKPRLNLQIRVPDDIEVTTTIERVPHKHNFAQNLNGVPRRARIDLTTARTGETIRNPVDDDTCCCVRG
jgi:hypothetical protein